MQISQISAPQLRELLDSPHPPHLIDVREPWEWQLTRIEGSRWIPLREVAARCGEIDRTHPTVIICHHGMRSLQVVAFLQRQGFDNLHNLAGGLDAWARQVDPALAVY
jgi:rhodanese-related sulfurtransferase